MPSPTPSRPNLLVIDDNDAVRAVLGAALRPEAFDVRLAAGGTEGGGALPRPARRPGAPERVDAGPERAPHPSRPAGAGHGRALLLRAGYADPLLAARLLAQGALDVLPKPFRLDELVATARRLLGAGRTAPTHPTAPGHSV